MRRTSYSDFFVVIVALFALAQVSVSVSQDNIQNQKKEHESTMVTMIPPPPPLPSSSSSSNPSLSSSLSNVLSRLTLENVAELEWETLPVRMEKGGRVACAAAAVSKNELVVVGGSNGYLSILASTKLLNVDTNKWTDLPNMNYARFCCGAATILDDNDNNQTAETTTAQTSDATGAATETETETETELSQSGKRVYVAGGMDGSGIVMSSVEVLDLSVDPPEWSMLEKNMSCGRWGCAVVSYRDRLYVIGGHNGTGPLKSSEVYLESTGEWRSLPDMSVARSQCAVAVINECIYVLGGTDAEGMHHSCEVYDMATNTWSSTALPDMKVARSGCCAAAIGNQLFCVGQVNPHYFAYQKYLSYLLIDTKKMLKPNTSNVACGETMSVVGGQQWMRLPPMATIRYQAALVALDNKQLVIVGGESHSKRHDTIERLVLKSVPVFVDFPPLPPHAVQEEGGKEDKQEETNPEEVLRGLELWLEQVQGLMELTDKRTERIQSELAERKERAAMRHRQAVSEEEQALEQTILRHQQTIQNLEIQAQRERALIEEASDAIRVALASWKSNATSVMEQTERRVQALYQETNLAPKTTPEPREVAEDSKQAPYPADLVCPLSKQLMEDPVVAADGHTYERQKIQEWFGANSSDEATKSPVTGEPLAHTHLIPNLAIRKQCQQQQQQR